jgi:hypothetical protein
MYHNIAMTLSNNSSRLALSGAATFPTPYRDSGCSTVVWQEHSALITGGSRNRTGTL